MAKLMKSTNELHPGCRSGPGARPSAVLASSRSGTRPAPAGSAGFSLLEVLVALTITGLILAIVATALHSVFRANERSREHLQLQQTMSATMARMRLYLQAAYLSPYMANQILTDFETMDTDSLNEPYDSLTFTTLAHSSHKIDAKEARMIEITLYTEEERPLETEEGNVETRRLRVRAGGAINDRFEVEGGTVYTLAEHVTRLEFEYLGGEGEWKPEWFPMDHLDDKGYPNLPCMVRVTIGMRTERLEEVEGSLIVPLEMSKLRCSFEDERPFEQ